jgi:hypothetical protein
MDVELKVDSLPRQLFYGLRKQHTRRVPPFDTGLIGCQYLARLAHLPERAIDPFLLPAHHEAMVNLAQSSQRRSQRVFHKMRLQAQGRSHEGRKFREICETLVVSAHGGLLNLRHEVDDGEMLVLVNPETQEEQECRIVYLGETGNRGTRVGVEFLTPAPHFWGIDFDACVTRPTTQQPGN